MDYMTQYECRRDDEYRDYLESEHHRELCEVEDDTDEIPF